MAPYFNIELELLVVISVIEICLKLIKFCTKSALYLPSCLFKNPTSKYNVVSCNILYR